jgi:hypothetical protein
VLSVEQQHVPSESLPEVDGEAKEAALPGPRSLTIHQFYYLFVYITDNQTTLQQAKARLNKLTHPQQAAPASPQAAASTLSSTSSSPPTSASSTGSTADAEDEDDCRTCSICLSHSVELALPCLHAFCSACIEDWHRHDRSCPLCRHASNVQGNSDVWVMDSGSEAELREQIQQIARFPHSYILDMPEYSA